MYFSTTAGNASCETGQRNREDHDFGAVGGFAHLVAVQRQTCFQTQGITGAKGDGSSAQLDQAIPQPHSLSALDEQLVADGLAGTAKALPLSV